ncbi:MAG: YceI family protein [Candidatus Baltobacteraceae bacterium]
MRAAALSLAYALLAIAAAPPAQRSIDTQRSKARFSVSHIWVERVTGTVPIAGGSVTIAPDSLIPIAASAQFDAAKIETDEPDRDAALRSPDFFDTAKFPTWTFVSTKVTPKSAAAFEMDGDLTVHGVTQPERLNVAASGDPAHPVYHATATIDRHAFGMAVTRLDPTIGSTVEVTLDVTLK